MKKMIFSIVGLAALTAATGCMAVSATDNSRGVKSTREVVAIGNEVYIVDTRTGDVRKLDISNARPFSTPAADSEGEVKASDMN